MSTIEQIDHAVDVLGKENLILLHASSTYPAYYEELNLRAIPIMHARYGVPVGYSGHETGIPSTVAAVVLGACCVERHITLDRSMWGSDQAASLEPNGISRVVRDIRLVEQSMGDGVKRVYDREQPIIKKLRRVDVAPQVKQLKAIALDVDGVLTDGGVWWGPNGEEWKRFSFADIMGVSLAHKAGLIVALISGEDSPLVDRFAVKMGITDVEKNCKDKARALRSFAERRGLALSDVTFMGDDVNDLEAMDLAGLAAAPANAVPPVLDARRVHRRRNTAATAPSASWSTRSCAPSGMRHRMKLSDYVIGFVADHGVKHVFLVPGGGAMHLNDSLSRREDIEFVCNLHEQASAIAAENYSKATNHLGVALVTTGPGAHQRDHRAGRRLARFDAVPLHLRTGEARRSDVPRRRHAARRPAGRCAGSRHRLHRAIRDEVRRHDHRSAEHPLSPGEGRVPGRHRASRSGLDRHSARRAGLSRSMPDDARWLRSVRARCPRQPDADLQTLVSDTIRALNRSERPLLLAGNGIRLARAEKEFRELVEVLEHSARDDMARDRSDRR